MKKKIHILLLTFVVFALFWSCSKKGNNGPADEITKQISLDGDSVTLHNVATVTFNQGTLSQSILVKVSKKVSPAIQDIFNDDKVFFGIKDIVDYEIRINTGAIQPQNPVNVVIYLPDDIISKNSYDYGLEVFGEMYVKNDYEKSNSFILVNSKYYQSRKTLEFSLSPDFFANELSSDGSYEAILKIATSQGPNFSLGKTTSSDDCSRFISCPAPIGSCKVKSSWAIVRDHPIYNVPRPHKGVDLAASQGDMIIAAAAGIVTEARTMKGYGKCVIISHGDRNGKFNTRYAHLSEMLVGVSQQVAEGDVIGLAGQTGDATAPHLHFEYFLSSDVASEKGTIDPMPHINTTSVRLITANATLTNFNDCNSPYGNHVGSSWSVVFNYQDPTNTITPYAKLVFQDVAPYQNPPFEVSIGSLVVANGLVTSPIFCAHFGSAEYIKEKVYLKLANGYTSNCVYFILQKIGSAQKLIHSEEIQTADISDMPHSM